MYFSEPSIVFVLIVLVVRSLATALHMPAMQASIPLLAPEEHLTKVAGWGRRLVPFHILLDQQLECRYWQLAHLNGCYY